ncbi:hypothetical protein ENU1_133930 [Entamoeba nuttalli P19]|uniref:Uncharacterized protein n=1 Tax=Entamoeba nuttalli (strain P19) TaxID=1076696 RepID=K2HT57_ENTNP|nr:hypothetical protein ENU1_133930 [Entamoeba nuttalli P19]EKE39305.1 hypothetical protein ENU1_133930 [Entamoeba nuttalli P19]|eukprot:XP_008858358.1 hypothetical protein ENU1_133930 [Entamoeba nuttalli P19]
MYGKDRRVGAIGCNNHQQLAAWINIVNKTPQILKVQMKYYSKKRFEKKLPIHIAVNEKCPTLPNDVHCLANKTRVEPVVQFMLTPQQSVYIASFAKDGKNTFITTEWIKIKTTPIKHTIGKAKLSLTDLDTIEILSSGVQNYVNQLNSELGKYGKVPHINYLSNDAIKRMELVRKNKPIQINMIHKQNKLTYQPNGIPNSYNYNQPININKNTQTNKKVTLKELMVIAKKNNKNNNVGWKNKKGFGLNFTRPSTLKTQKKTSNIVSIMTSNDYANMTNRIARNVVLVVVCIAGVVLIPLGIYVTYQSIINRKRLEEFQSF